MNEKTCTKCKKTFPATKEYFHKNKYGKFGLRSRCKPCVIVDSRKWLCKRESPEKARERARIWGQENPEKVYQKSKEWRQNQPAAIYCITNSVNKKVYIGETTICKARWPAHKSALRTQKHGNSQLQEDWNKYGEESFIFQIIEELPSDTSKDMLLEKEEEYIKQYLNEGKLLYNEQRRIM